MDNKQLLDLAEKNVVRIECENVIQNITQPYMKKSLGNSFGSGFFISSKHILTNHHVIEYATKVFINIPFIGKESLHGKIACYSIDNDYAIIEIENYNHKHKLFKIGDSNKLKPGESLKVCGFPLANINPNLKIVNGVVSGWERNKIQHDTNTNPGMSGGMVLNSKNEAIAIHIGVISGKGWTNTAYAIPINIMNIKKRIKNLSGGSRSEPLSIKTPAYGFSTQITHIDLLKSIIRNNKYLKPGYGVLVNKILKNFKTDMKIGDILFSVLDHTIDNYKDIKFKENSSNKITYEYLSDYKDVNDPYTIIYYSKSKDKLVKETHKFQEKKIHIPDSLKDLDYFQDKINYVNIGGFIVVELTADHIQLFAGNKEMELVYKLMKFKSKRKDKSVLIVSHVFPTTPIYKNKIIKPGSIIVQVNGKEVFTLDDYKKQLRQSKKYAVFVLDNNKIEVLNMELANKIDAILSKQFNVPITLVHK